ncbi:Golgi to ER traffic protein 4 homolog [Dendronephthya gigantea]|uniref:Golgi to ER traffic protein 4 homolog n=1 Tax=Dendronephthya gigantea TaxID=151771 RepID=UPI001069BAC1|nr:Golgi to ER traffic protein 4 homolog [Dendronephthya gigantea]
MAETLNRGARRVLSKLQKSIEDGDHYEAHQMIRTLYFRYMSQTKHKDALDLVYDGATVLLNHGQEESGLDLCQLMLKCFEEADFSVNDETLEKITAHFLLFKPCSANRHEFIDGALSWTAKKSKEWTFGHPRLNLLCAETYWKERNYGEAQSHFLHANSGQQCATMLIEYAVTCGYPSEADLFVAQAVLQFLCLKRSSTAHCVFVRYTGHHPDFSGIGPPFEKPLLNFLWILLIIIDRKGTINQFTVLCEKYHPSLNRDPNYLAYLDKIGQLFFGLTPKPKEPSMNNFLGNLLQGLTSDEAEEATTSSVEMKTEDLD